MSGLGAVICSWEDEGGVTVSDLTLSNSWATNSMICWIFRARKKRSFGKKQSSDLDHSVNGLWNPRAIFVRGALIKLFDPVFCVRCSAHFAAWCFFGALSDSTSLVDVQVGESHALGRWSLPEERKGSTPPPIKNYCVPHTCEHKRGS